MRPGITDFEVQKDRFYHLTTKNMKAVLLFLGGVGMQEILLIGLFVLVFFGAKKIPDFMKGLGKGVNEFKNGMKEVKQDIESQSQIEK